MVVIQAPRALVVLVTALTALACGDPAAPQVSPPSEVDAAPSAVDATSGAAAGPHLVPGIPDACGARHVGCYRTGAPEEPCRAICDHELWRCVFQTLVDVNPEAPDAVQIAAATAHAAVMTLPRLHAWISGADGTCGGRASAAPDAEPALRAPGDLRDEGRGRG